MGRGSLAEAASGRAAAGSACPAGQNVALQFYARVLFVLLNLLTAQLLHRLVFFICVYYSPFNAQGEFLSVLVGAGTGLTAAASRQCKHKRAC